MPPSPDGLLCSLLSRLRREIGPKTLITRPCPTGDGGQGTDLYLKQHGFETAFAGDVPKRLADQMWAEQRPLSQAAFASLFGDPARKVIPSSWYLVATHDHAIPSTTQRFMAARAHATTAQVQASHAPMIPQPAATTRLILKAVKATSRRPLMAGSAFHAPPAIPPPTLATAGVRVSLAAANPHR
jgi:Alpha/beta hydrolase family